MARMAIDDAEAQRFLDEGYLIVRGVLAPAELAQVRAAMDELTAYGSAAVREDPDFAYGAGHRSGTRVLRRVEYVIDKRDEMKVLLANPFILRSVEKLIGPDFIPTWDSMVLKLPGEGIIVPWHRDAGTDCVGDRPIFNVDFYLDEADESTCVWVVPGSNHWGADRVAAWLAERRDADRTVDDFRRSGAVPALMQPGDVLFHNILVVHGSPQNESPKLRRVVYYEFRAAHVEAELGPHRPEYIPLKQRLLQACLRRRAAEQPAADEVPYVYCPPAPWNAAGLAPGEELSTYRYAHADYWRSP